VSSIETTIFDYWDATILHTSVIAVLLMMPKFAVKISEHRHEFDLTAAESRALFPGHAPFSSILDVS